MPGKQVAVPRTVLMRLVALAAVVTALVGAGASPALAAAPTVISVSPLMGPVAGGTTVTISGSGFTNVTPGVPCPAVKFGATSAASCNVVNDTTISATTPAGASAGAVQVTVTNNTAETSTAAVNFTYVAQPVVSTLSPVTGSTSGGTTVAITGTGLLNTSSVSFGGTPATSITVQNDNLLSVTAPAHAAGAVTVTVTTPGGTSVAGAGTTYTYTLAPAPVITAVSPTSGTTSGGTVVTITGTDLLGATGVTFGGSPGTSISNVTATSLQVTTPAHAAGLVDVQVTTPSGPNVQTAASKYTYVASTLPVVTSVSPVAGPLAGGTVVTVSGTGFTGTTQVLFGGVAGTNITNVTATSLQVTTPARATAGPVDVIVTATGGTSVTSSVAKFTYASVPAVTAVTPGGGPTTGGTVVTLTGTGFTGATTVTFGGIAGTALAVASDTSLTVTTPAGTAGTADVLVTTPLGQSAVAAGAKFTYGATVPSITSLSPTSGASGTVVTISGTGFLGATSVTFGGTAGTSLTVTSNTSITVTAPAGTGTVDVVVVGPLGSSAVGTQAKFTYQGATISYTLTFRWSLVAWNGTDGMGVANALKGIETPDNAATNNVYSSVTAVFRWNGGSQKWEAFFPGSEGVPGANDFSTFSKGQAYWIATNATGSIVWTVAQG
ncbi:MAG: IPT/TIG domain-containing protein [Dehalococcoidia bacterium]|nr:IPT/TIG domain-containing protein [Dehalococcoidia bacterium]